MQYPLPPWEVTNAGATLSLREHFEFYARPQLHVSLVLYRFDTWTLGPQAEALIASLVLGVRRIYAAASLGGFTLGRLDYRVIPSSSAAALHFSNVPGAKDVGDITYAFYGHRSGSEDVNGETRYLRWFEVYLFESWLETTASGVSPFNVCSDFVAGPVIVDGAPHLYRRPTMTLTPNLGPVNSVAVFTSMAGLVRTMAHEIGHFVARRLHPLFGSPSLMMQSKNSLSTAVGPVLAEDFLSSCMMNEGCSLEAPGPIGSVAAQVVSPWPDW